MPPHTKADMKARVDIATAELVRAAIEWRTGPWDYSGIASRRKEVRLKKAIDALVEATDG